MQLLMSDAVATGSTTLRQPGNMTGHPSDNLHKGHSPLRSLKRSDLVEWFWSTQWVMYCRAQPVCGRCISRRFLNSTRTATLPLCHSASQCRLTWKFVSATNKASLYGRAWRIYMLVILSSLAMSLCMLGREYEDPHWLM